MDKQNKMTLIEVDRTRASTTMSAGAVPLF